MNFDEMMSRTTLKDTGFDQSLEYIGRGCDAALDAERTDVLRHLVTLAATVSRDTATPEKTALLDYFLGNVWSGIKTLESRSRDSGWQWENIAAENEIIHFRRAIELSENSALSVHRVGQVTTNLANCYLTIGRPVEAIELWRDAVAKQATFGMSRGNLGRGLWKYALLLYDDRDRLILVQEAWRYLDPAKLRGLDPGAGEAFARFRDEIERAIPIEVLRKDVECDDGSLGKTEPEIAYRRWCLLARLFLNPLNDCGAFTLAACDRLTAPSIVSGANEGPKFHGFFNQLKQEYVSARWLIYEALEPAEEGAHFADHDVLLFNTLDYPSYGLATEKLKLGFRSLYSLFDKIAFFLNAYLGLQIPETKVSFRNVWYQKRERKNGLREEFIARRNLPLKGLFWLSKDLYEDSTDFRVAMNPTAKRMSEIRHHLEHKYLKLHDELWPGKLAADAFSDDLAHSMYRAELGTRSKELLSLTRSAIIYLSLAVHREERLKAATAPKNRVTVPMNLDVWEDDWKK